jgi:hypothetical protein
MKYLVALGAVCALSGCAAISAIGGNGSDCASAQKQLGLARASLIVAQLAVTTAEGFGNPPAVMLAQQAVTAIDADIVSIQTLVTQSCAVPAPTPAPTFAMSRRAARASITLDQAKKRAAADWKLANALKEHGG